MSDYAHYYCPHCCPNGVMFTSCNWVPPVVARYCETYWELIDAHQERNRNHVMWQALK